MTDKYARKAAQGLKGYGMGKVPSESRRGMCHCGSTKGTNAFCHDCMSLK
jgi:hypothetical protein